MKMSNQVTTNYGKEIFGGALVTAGFVLLNAAILREWPFMLVISGIMMGAGLVLISLNLLDFSSSDVMFHPSVYYVVIKRNDTYELWTRISTMQFRRIYSHVVLEEVEQRMKQHSSAEHWLTEFHCGPFTEYLTYNHDAVFVEAVKPRD